MKIRISHVMALGIVLSEAALLPQAVAGVPPSTQHATSRDANARDAAQSKLDHTKAMDSLYIGALFGTVKDSYLAHAKAIQKSNKPIMTLLNHDAYIQAVSLLQKAVADPDNSWAAYTLGHLYSAGLGVSANQQQAFHWYLRAANAGDHFAQRQVANDYLNGWGVTANPKLAAFWFRQGVMVPQVVDADAFLGEAYATGSFLPKNPGKAQWYLHQSKQLLRTLYNEKVGAAAFDLGMDSLSGEGSPRNSIKAEHYFQQAVTWHYPPAVNALQYMQKESHS